MQHNQYVKRLHETAVERILCPPKAGVGRSNRLGRARQRRVVAAKNAANSRMSVAPLGGAALGC